jgi:glycosyltransferase involved in cell wall biosynthesis
MPTVSIIMNCYNGEEFLREAIDSVYGQTYTDWEIILWDDASTDSTPEIANSYDERLRYFKGQKSKSLGEARNHALEMVRGDFIAFLDQDDIWLPEKLSLQIPLFSLDAEVGIVIGNVLNRRNLSDKPKYSRTNIPPSGYVYKDLVKNYIISIPTAVIRKSTLLLLEYWFDPRFNMIEEYDLFLRISLIAKLRYIDKVIAIYRTHSNNLSSKNVIGYAVEHDVYYKEMRSTIMAEGGKELDKAVRKQVKMHIIFAAIRDKEYRLTKISELSICSRIIVVLGIPLYALKKMSRLTQ